MTQQNPTPSSQTLVEQVNANYGFLFEAKQDMQRQWSIMQDSEETAISDLGEAWISAKNNDIRKALVREQLANDQDYQDARLKYREARDAFRLAQIEVERVKTLTLVTPVAYPAVTGFQQSYIPS